MRRLALAAIVCTLAALGVSPAALADDKVSGQTYFRHDGGTDAEIVECNNPSTNPAFVAPSGGDADPNDGGTRRQGNEPASVIDPTDDQTIIASWNDACSADLGSQWQGFAYSRDGGATWRNSMIPGYPHDTSAEGMASPLQGNSAAGDPIAAFDNAGNLFVGGISFNFAKPTNGHVYVASYGTTPPACAATTCPGYPVDYLRTRIVGVGTPSVVGIFQDKPMLEVDRTGGPNDGNVYVCWSRFTGNQGQNKIFFSRSTDSGNTFSRPISISKNSSAGVHSVQGCDIAIEADGDIYLVFRTIDDRASKTTGGLGWVRSTDGGQTFSDAQLIRPIVIYNPFDSTRDCGDGAFLCPADFVFHRVPLEPRITADQTGALPGVYVTYNAVDPASIVASNTSYSSAGAGQVGQSLVYVVRTLDNGGSWSNPLAVDQNAAGHQFFPDVDAHNGRLALVWQDSRTDPDYSVQFPIGNEYVTFGGANRGHSSGTTIVTTRSARLASALPLTFASTLVSDVAHQSEYEMFGARQIPFHGDYNWISIHQNGTAYMTWTDNRDVVPGDDPRETDPDGDGVHQGFDDDFDVSMCVFFEGGAYTGNRCGNNGGLDQNIYGDTVTLP